MYDLNERMIARPVDTKTKILDAAEKLFGQNGFESTSLRDITAEADVNLASVNYHFQSKDSLIDAVIKRRIEPVNCRRLEMLEVAGPNPTLEQILLAFIQPVFAQDPTPIIPLMGRIFTSPDDFARRMFKNHLSNIAQRFLQEFGKAAPHLSYQACVWRMHFAAGAMANVLSRSHLLQEAAGIAADMSDINDRMTVAARLVEFAAAGFRAPEGF